jgi:hypothetical protein
VEIHHWKLQGIIAVRRHFQYFRLFLKFCFLDKRGQQLENVLEQEAKENNNVNGCVCCGVYGNFAFNCLKGYNHGFEYTICIKLWRAIYCLLTEQLKSSNETLLSGTSCQSLEFMG